MAMHVHAAFSEGTASMETHLDQAQKSGIDVLWWTEHDFRMVARNYPTVVHFDGLTETVSGSTVEWTPTNSGAGSAATGSIVTSPVSAVVPLGRGSRRRRPAG